MRIVPDILEWELTQRDINKDFEVGGARPEGLQYAGIKVQVKHFDYVFRMYIKSIGKDTACRVEQFLNPKKPVIQALSEIVTHPTQEKQHESLSSYSYDDNTIKITVIHDMVKSLLNVHRPSSAIVVEPPELAEGRATL
jgi:hypothetical protein